MKKKILFTICLLLIMIPCMGLFAGCDLHGDELTNGNYKVVTYLVDGESQSTYIGSIATFNNGTFTDWLDKTATYTIQDNKITVSWKNDAEIDRTLSGEFTKTTISLSGVIGEKSCVINLLYVEDVSLTNGDYVVKKYIVDGVVDNEIVGSIATIDKGAFTDWLGNKVTYQIKCDQITMTWQKANADALVLVGRITTNNIFINTTNGGHTYNIVLEKK